MSAFQYQALNAKGQTAKGVIEADSERHARQLLREQGLIPTALHNKKQRDDLKRQDKLKADELCLFTRQLATLLTAGIPIDEALRGVAEQAEMDKTRQLIIALRAKVMEGYGLAQSMAEFPKAFPTLYRATLAAGEHTGRLDLILEKLADYTENQQRIRQKIQQALIYPSVMILVSVIIIGFLLAFVVPNIVDVFSSSGQILPGMTLALIYISHGVKRFGVVFLLVIILGVMLFKQQLKNPKALLKWHRFLLRLPILSFLIKTVNVARYIHTFGILFSAGASVLETMNVAASLVNNLLMKQAFIKASVEVNQGTAIHLALKKTGFLRPMALNLIASGEKSGQLASMMERAAIQLDNEVKSLVDTALTLLEPMIILLMGAVVLFIVLSTLLPIFSMEQLIN